MGAGAAAHEVPDGIDLRKEAQKIDLKQFNPDNVEHVIPIISVMRPPTGFRDKLSTAPSGNPVATLNSKDMIPLTKAEEKKEAKRVEA